MTKFDNAELLFGTLEAARQSAETEARVLVFAGTPETAADVVSLDRVVTAIEAFQALHDEEE